MSLWRHVTRGFRVLMARDAADQDIADEVDHYFEQATAELIAAGRSPEDARRIARLELGSAGVIREQVRSYGWESYVDAAVNDVRFAARQLRNAPGFALVGVCTIALGVGVTTAIFSAVNPILFDPLPYPAPDRITMISDRATDGSVLDVTFGTFREVTQRSRSFDALAVTRSWAPAITGAAEPQRLDGQRV